MPQLNSHPSAKLTKMLLIGDSGSGKTGSLASLAAAGYHLRIVDLDSGLDVLANLLRDGSRYPREALSNVSYRTITDRMRNQGGKLVPSKAEAWTNAIKTLENWKTDEEDYGSITTWGERDVLVIDSLTMLSNAAMNFVLMMNARLGQQPHQSDWYTGQGLIEGLLQMLYDEGVSCNVIVISHIAYIESDTGMSRGYPNTLGKALPPKVGRYFNSILLARTTGSGENQKRRILTNTSGVIELKNTAPSRVKSEYPLETGLADYFRDVRSAAEEIK